MGVWKTFRSVNSKHLAYAYYDQLHIHISLEGKRVRYHFLLVVSSLVPVSSRQKIIQLVLSWLNEWTEPTSQSAVTQLSYFSRFLARGDGMINHKDNNPHASQNTPIAQNLRMAGPVAPRSDGLQPVLLDAEFHSDTVS